MIQVARKARSTMRVRDRLHATPLRDEQRSRLVDFRKELRSTYSLNRDCSTAGAEAQENLDVVTQPIEPRIGERGETRSSMAPPWIAVEGVGDVFPLQRNPSIHRLPTGNPGPFHVGRILEREVDYCRRWAEHAGEDLDLAIGDRTRQYRAILQSTSHRLPQHAGSPSPPGSR